MILERRVTSLWRASDRKGRRRSMFGFGLAWLNFALMIANAWAGTWWIVPFSFVFGLACLWSAESYLKAGVERETVRWWRQQARLRANWKWN